MFDLTNVWPTYVFLVEVYNRQRTILRKNVGLAPLYMRNKTYHVLKYCYANFTRQIISLLLKEPHLNKSEDYISNILQCMKAGMEEETLKTADVEYLNLLGDERQMKRNPDLVQR